MAGQDTDATFGRIFLQTYDESTIVQGPIQSISADDIFSTAGCNHGELDILKGLMFAPSPIDTIYTGRDIKVVQSAKRVKGSGEIAFGSDHFPIQIHILVGQIECFRSLTKGLYFSFDCLFPYGAIGNSHLPLGAKCHKEPCRCSKRATFL